MKKSALKDYIKEQIVDILTVSEMEGTTDQDVRNQKELNKLKDQERMKAKAHAAAMDKYNMEEQEDAPEGDKDIEKKSRGNDKIIKDFRRIQKQMQTHLQMFKDAEGEKAKEAAKKMLSKLTPEFQAAKKAYDKIK